MHIRSSEAMYYLEIQHKPLHHTNTQNGVISESLPNLVHQATDLGSLKLKYFAVLYCSVICDRAPAQS